MHLIRIPKQSSNKKGTSIPKASVALILMPQSA